VPCAPAQSQVAQQPFQQQAVALCWLNCSLSAQAPYTAKWSGHNPVTAPSGAIACDWSQARISISNGAGLQWDGHLFLAYSRTWAEVAPSGNAIQVWRYLANGDMRIVGTTPLPCGVPGCASAFARRLRFTGYIDYARECGTTVTERAWMLTHACDAIDHAAGSPRAGSFHAGQSFTFVGPAAGFAPAAGASPESGAMTIDCVRKWNVTAAATQCTQEERLTTGTISPLAPTCMCGVGPASWHQAQLSVTGMYGTTLAPFAGSDPFRSFQIGMWTNPAVFPGVEEVRWNCNEGQWIDCSGVTRQESYFGVTTHNGFPAFSIDATVPPFSLGTMFIDQGNSILFPAAVPILNVPYRSDHIVNLNM
jgi:hypothetical protein